MGWWWNCKVRGAGVSERSKIRWKFISNAKQVVVEDKEQRTGQLPDVLGRSVTKEQQCLDQGTRSGGLTPSSVPLLPLTLGGEHHYLDAFGGRGTDTGDLTQGCLVHDT
jgi:hypothetical protein